MIISRLIIPREEDEGKQKLYFRGEIEGLDKKEGIRLSKGQNISFDTYFNGFFYSDYLRYTNVKDVRLVLVTDGTVKLSLMYATEDSGPLLLEERIVNGYSETSFAFVTIDDLPEIGVIYPTIESLSENSCVISGRYETNCNPQKNIKLAVGICTYKREDYVIRNLDNVEREIWNDCDNPINNDIDFFIIDNGHTLPELDKEHVTLLKNKNYGGSGGFTRALMEIYYKKDVYSHFLLMDDDLTFETEILVKTVQFLKVANDNEYPIYIGGQMLRESKPMMQHEAGAWFNKGYVSAQGLDYRLWTIHDLFRNCERKKIEYNAWWYCCMPVNTIKENGLPLPLFIRDDDIEYGLRAKGKFAIMNGIGVWHADFQSKTSRHLNYYIVRNGLIVVALHKKKMNLREVLTLFTKRIFDAFEKGDMVQANIVIQAVSDFLKGPSFLKKTDEERLNKKLMADNKKTEMISGRRYLSFIMKYCWTLFKLAKGYKGAKKKYNDGFKELTSFEFWEKHLDIAK